MQQENQSTIYAWARSTFGEPRSNLQIAARALKEMGELIEKLALNDNDPAAAEEVADVVIVLSQIPERLGVDLDLEVDRKMSINRERRWKTNGDGTGQHVEDQAESLRELVEKAKPCPTCKGFRAVAVGGPRVRAVDCPDCVGGNA